MCWLIYPHCEIVLSIWPFAGVIILTISRGYEVRNWGGFPLNHHLGDFDSGKKMEPALLGEERLVGNTREESPRKDLGAWGPVAMAVRRIEGCHVTYPPPEEHGSCQDLTPLEDLVPFTEANWGSFHVGTGECSAIGPSHRLAIAGTGCNAPTQADRELLFRAVPHATFESCGIGTLKRQQNLKRYSSNGGMTMSKQLHFMFMSKCCTSGPLTKESSRQKTTSSLTKSNHAFLGFVRGN